jgi:hypothetical protein
VLAARENSPEFRLPEGRLNATTDVCQEPGPAIETNSVPTTNDDFTDWVNEVSPKPLNTVNRFNFKLLLSFNKVFWRIFEPWFDSQFGGFDMLALPLSIR